MKFDGKVVAISGAAGGIGAATARRFREGGAELILIDQPSEALSSLAAELGAKRIVHCDQTQNEQIVRACEEVGEVDIFINNAGVILRKPLFEHSFQDIDSIFSINITGAMKLAIGLARKMRKSTGGRGGVIVNIATQHAFGGGGGRAAYAASKAAMVQFTKASSVEWIEEGIRVCGVAPGPVSSPMTEIARQSSDYVTQVIARMPIGRFLEMGEIADIILSVSAPEMSALVGVTVLADGGGTLS